LIRLIGERAASTEKNIKMLEKYGVKYKSVNDGSKEYYELKSEITLLKEEVNELESVAHLLKKENIIYHFYIFNGNLLYFIIYKCLLDNYFLY